MDIYEIIRRWHSKQSISRISQALGYDRKTVRKYIQAAKVKGITPDKPLPAKDEVRRLLQNVIPTTQRPFKAQDTLQPFLEEITALIQNKENPLKPKSAFEVLCERHQLHTQVSYSSFKRYIKKHYLVISPERSTCRIEVNPGSEVQFDYAKMGLLRDPRIGKRKTVYAFIATLSYSRHKYVELVYSQNQQSFVASHVHMFEYFDGVVDRLLLDNLKNGILKPNLYEPTLNRSYRELAEHYHCFIDPCRVSHPKDKGTRCTNRPGTVPKITRPQSIIGYRERKPSNQRLVRQPIWTKKTRNHSAETIPNFSIPGKASPQTAAA
jgi:transposase